MARQNPNKPPFARQPPASAPAPDEPVPFPENGGGPPKKQRARTASGQFVPRQTQPPPATNGQHQPPFFPQQPFPQQETVAEPEPFVDEPVDGYFETASHQQTALPQQLDDERQASENLATLQLAADCGMLVLSGHILTCLSQFRQEYFRKHNRILSLSQAWGLLVGTVNLALPPE